MIKFRTLDRALKEQRNNDVFWGTSCQDYDCIQCQWWRLLLARAVNDSNKAAVGPGASQLSIALRGWETPSILAAPHG